VKQQNPCLNCGKNLSHRKQQDKYCSYDCFYKSRYKIVNPETGKSRIDLYFEVIEFMKQGFSQAESARRVGVNASTFSVWYNKHGRELSAKNSCQYCGANFGEKAHGKRKYCSKSCVNKARRRRENPKTKGRKTYSPKLHKKAMEMAQNGMGARKIAKLLNIPLGTTTSWLYRSRKKKEKA
jgi:transposase-like protein